MVYLLIWWFNHSLLTVPNRPLAVPNRLYNRRAHRQVLLYKSLSYSIPSSPAVDSRRPVAQAVLRWPSSTRPCSKTTGGPTGGNCTRIFTNCDRSTGVPAYCHQRPFGLSSDHPGRYLPSSVAQQIAALLTQCAPTQVEPCANNPTAAIIPSPSHAAVRRVASKGKGLIIPPSGG